MSSDELSSVGEPLQKQRHIDQETQVTNPHITELSERGTINGQALGMVEDFLVANHYIDKRDLETGTLVDILKTYQEEVRNSGYTNKELAAPLFAIYEAAEIRNEKEIILNEVHFDLSYRPQRSFRDSPFLGEGHSVANATRTNTADIEVQKSSTRETLFFNGMLAHFVGDIGLYYRGKTDIKTSDGEFKSAGPKELAEFFEISK